ncbi:hypothetical protein NDU88_000306 [Pleurodeles waltl]|uniref:Uncharacterized protein n=1 Tax=Pleurodeles waltl TaxID=8319 RepID=A0AAV7LU79_PLEWA|nr:hypothetical protein NDU88_000306 [Pleurodeles waltl]
MAAAGRVGAVRGVVSANVRHSSNQSRRPSLSGPRRREMEDTRSFEEAAAGPEAASASSVFYRLKVAQGEARDRREAHVSGKRGGHGNGRELA